jgi:hypothetical protein
MRGGGSFCIPFSIFVYFQSRGLLLQHSSLLEPLISYEENEVF